MLSITHDLFLAMTMLTDEELVALERPTQLDFVEFCYEGVTFQVYGTLHGVSGGLNAEYRHFVTDSIQSIKSTTDPKILILSEKGMTAMYSKAPIDAELDDWLVLRPRDAFVLGLQMILDPLSLRVLTLDLLVELLQRSDRFNQTRQFKDLAGSPYTHALSPQRRRFLAGFPSPMEGFQIDLERLSGDRTILPRPRKNIPHPCWARLLRMERVMHIPVRSWHMLNFAVQFAQSKGINKIALLVGETHNSDMEVLAKPNALNDLSLAQKKMADKVAFTARKHGLLSAKGTGWHVRLAARLIYMTCILSGGFVGLMLWMILLIILTGNWQNLVFAVCQHNCL